VLKMTPPKLASENDVLAFEVEELEGQIVQLLRRWHRLAVEHRDLLGDRRRRANRVSHGLTAAAVGLRSAIDALEGAVADDVAAELFGSSGGDSAGIK
jgi:hypothetical protein